MRNSTVEMLGDLIDICEDGRAFYDSAAYRTNSRSLGESFRRIASTRESVIINLKLHALSLVGEAAEEEFGVRKAPCLFEPLKSEVDGAALALVKKLEKAENETLKQFQEALNREPPEATINLIERQMQILNETYVHMKLLKHRLGNAA